MRIAQALTGAFASILLMTGAASGQAAAPAASPAPPARPEIKAVGDWFVRCFPAQSPSPCDVFQELDNQNTRRRVLSLSLAFVPNLDRHIVQITVPLDVSIPKGVVIQTDSYIEVRMVELEVTKKNIFGLDIGTDVRVTDAHVSLDTN